MSTTQQAVRPTDPTGGRPVVPSTGVLRPLGLSEIALTGGFWSCRQRTNAQATLAHCQMWMERLGWVANFDRVADATTRPDRPGLVFSDSEIYKLLEAMAWEFGRTGDLRVDAAFRALSERVVRAQDADGYLNTSFGHGGQAPRYCDLAGGHELYCAGHLLQAAVARLRTYGVDELVEAARRSADHVCDTFGAGGIASVCGHPEIELGLVELGRALGEQRYVDQALLFVDRRGHGTLGDHAFGREYYQDDVPVRDADAWRGHAVRALYLSAAAVDVAVERKDQVLLEAIARQWANTVARRTYLTGGMGSHHQDEGFGRDWVLPADRAYCETCAGVGSVMVSWRLFLATGDVRYADLIERTFFNIVATSVREDGRAFFYANTLHQRVPGPAVTDDEVSPRASSSMRAPWFDVSCCPTNLARTMATWHTYAAAIDRTGLSICQYAAATVRTTLQARPCAPRCRTGGRSAWTSRRTTPDRDWSRFTSPGRRLDPGPCGCAYRNGQKEQSYRTAANAPWRTPASSSLSGRSPSEIRSRSTCPWHLVSPTRRHTSTRFEAVSQSNADQKCCAWSPSTCQPESAWTRS